MPPQLPIQKHDQPPVVVKQPLPVYLIDLDLPPAYRFRQVAVDYKDKLSILSNVLDFIITSGTLHPDLQACLEAKQKHRKRHAATPVSEYMEELQAFTSACGGKVSMKAFLAFNTLLDSLLGCTSGAVRSFGREEDSVDDDRSSSSISSGTKKRKTGDHSNDRSQMLHFRNLDWGMDELRGLLVQLNFVRGGVVVAEAISHAGYTGVLTGVRKHLSMSLNFRSVSTAGIQGDGNRNLDLDLLEHKKLVLLGRRASVGHVLRDLLVNSETVSMGGFVEDLQSTPTSPCYVTLCNGRTAVHLEKDLRELCVAEESDDFLAATNHDMAMEGWTRKHWKEYIRQHAEVTSLGMGMRDLLKDSLERKQCIVKLFKEAVGVGGKVESRGNSKKRKTYDSKSEESQFEGSGNIVAHFRDIEVWLQTWPVFNECTQFSCIMSPESGRLIWSQMYDQPGPA
ncbi:hypothetical protein HDU76_013929 [Blyttiomyces sp. JEL0837]|nr:hypothetical protein HDU76_013929 [Blyttiomyces sp. JEL0837]